MIEFPKPKVVVSKCIEFEYCRWNANIISSPLVQILKNYVEFFPVCAEVEIGLGIPRDPVRLILENEKLKMMQPKTGKEYTDQMTSFAKGFFNSIEELDGLILKADSPSCGLYHTKYYQSSERGAPRLGSGPGLFGRAALEVYPNKAIESEGRLTNFRIREHWLIKLYTLARFRTVKESDLMHELVQFHTQNKFLFMAYNQNLMRGMGRMVANPSNLSFQELTLQYGSKLDKMLEHPPEYTAHINALMHALGYFKKDLSHEEKSFFLDELEKFRAGWIPLFVLINLLQSWIVRFEESYLNKQTYFRPYPEELMNFDLKDSWRGRSYWD